MLINCPECQKECSDTIKTCPHCGYKLNKKSKPSNNGLRDFITKHKKTSITLLSTVSLFLFIALFIIVFHDKFIPNYVGDNIEDVIGSLGKKGYSYSIEYQDVVGYNKGVIYEQSKHFFSFSREELVLYVCQNRLYEMPDIVNKSFEDIQNEEYISTLKIEEVYIQDKNIAIGTIISSSVEAGETYKSGEAAIEVCVGYTTDIAFARQQHVDEAKKALADMGITNIKVKYDFSETIAKNNVMLVVPTAVGDLNEEVTLTISRGPSMYVSDYIGYSEESAKEYLSSDGFKNILIDYTYNDDVKCNINETEFVVADQNLKGKVELTDTIRLTVTRSAVEVSSMDIDINSVGGVDTYITFTNCSDKQIAYVNFRVGYYDKMGNPAECRIKDTALINLQYTGPLNPGSKANRIYWRAVLYDPSVAAICIKDIEVKFSDGTTQTIENTGTYWYFKGYYGGDLNYID